MLRLKLERMVAEWIAVERNTIHNWPTRLEERDLDEAIRDKHRAGRPRKLGEEQLEKLRDILQNPPTEAEFDAPAWTTELLQELIRDQFNIDYSRPSRRRLMKEAGRSYQTLRKAASETDPEDCEAFEREIKKPGHVWMASMNPAAGQPASKDK